MAKQIISLSGLFNYFQDDQNVLSKGETKYYANYVLQVTIDGFEIKGIVRASMKDSTYKVGLTVNGDDGLITSATCECPRGRWICSHMAATAIHVNRKGFSKTDLPNSWINRPRTMSKQESSVKSMAGLFPPSKPKYTAAARCFSEVDREFFLNALSSENVDCPFRWMLLPEPEVNQENNAPPLIESLLPIYAVNKEQFIKQVEVTKEQQQWIANATKDQRKSHIWGQYRRLCLTGSNFGLVLDAMKRKELSGRDYPPSLFKTLKGEYYLGNRDSIIWGQMHEEVALQAYIEETNNNVTSTGLHLFPCGYLGCTPDGIISSKSNSRPGALEIKCPFKYRDSTIKEMVEQESASQSKLKGFFLTKNYKLNPSHNYWHQVQAEIAVLGVTWAHFVVWTNKDMLIVSVSKDENWEKINITLLSDFYVNTLLPNCYTTEK